MDNRPHVSSLSGVQMRLPTQEQLDILFAETSATIRELRDMDRGGNQAASIPEVMEWSTQRDADPVHHGPRRAMLRNWQGPTREKRCRASSDCGGTLRKAPAGGRPARWKLGAALDFRRHLAMMQKSWMVAIMADGSRLSPGTLTDV